MSKDNKCNELLEWLNGIYYDLNGVRYWLRRNQITKAHTHLIYCCEYADEMLDIIGRK